jgi:hypothetical protein
MTPAPSQRLQSFLTSTVCLPSPEQDMQITPKTLPVASHLEHGTESTVRRKRVPSHSGQTIMNVTYRRLGNAGNDLTIRIRPDSAGLLDAR